MGDFAQAQLLGQFVLECEFYYLRPKPSFTLGSS